MLFTVSPSHKLVLAAMRCPVGDLVCNLTYPHKLAPSHVESVLVALLNNIYFLFSSSLDMQAPRRSIMSDQWSSEPVGLAMHAS